MNKDNTLTGVIGLLVGIVITGFVAGQAVNNNNSGMMRMMGINTSKSDNNAAKHNSMTMEDMHKQLEGLSGDAFDKAFIEMMIAHHEGAVDMAELIPSRAKHSEIKTLGQAIITAQNQEIADMKKWQQDWGYSSDEMMEMMHGNGSH